MAMGEQQLLLGLSVVALVAIGLAGCDSGSLEAGSSGALPPDIAPPSAKPQRPSDGRNMAIPARL